MSSWLRSSKAEADASFESEELIFWCIISIDSFSVMFSVFSFSDVCVLPFCAHTDDDEAFRFEGALDSTRTCK